MEGHSRDDRPAVKCFTCPRERRGDESGWYFVDVPDRARAYGPARIFVCPRHYRYFAERERGRWIELVETPVAAEVPAPVAALVPAEVSMPAEPLVLVATPALVAAPALVPAETTVVALAAADALTSDS